MSIILLVDSDPLHGFGNKAILEQRFRSVKRVGDASEVLCLVEQPQFAGHLGLVICDANLHGIGSLALAEELHERRPELPVLILGYGGELRGKHWNGWLSFLPRPFSAEDILSAVDQLLVRDTLDQHADQAA